LRHSTNDSKINQRTYTCNNKEERDEIIQDFFRVAFGLGSIDMPLEYKIKKVKKEN